MRVCFTHLGCKLNQAEIEAMARRFTAAGHQLVGSPAGADLHVVNSCTVTQAAARQSRKATRGGGRAHPGLRTVVTGCWSAAEPGAAAALDGVDLVVPNGEKERLFERVAAAFPELAVAETAETDPVPVPWVAMEMGHTRALVKVEDGCNMQCAFCIIPQTRGRQRSRPPGEVVAEVQALARAGCREVVLTGVQISAYCFQGAQGLGLADLVARVLAEGEAPRLRLTSIAPWELDDRLLELFAEHGGRRLCRHFHLSLQSGCSATLRRMRRPYTAQSYADLLARVRQAVPEVAITTDVLVGFPGETAAEFAASQATVAAAGFAKVHVFPFSPRPGTAAAEMPGQVAPEEKKERTARMLEVAAAAERAFLARQVGRRVTVLWERPRGERAHGLTDNYIRVFCQTDRDLWNRFVEAEVVGLAGGAAGGVVGQLPSVR